MKSCVFLFSFILLAQASSFAQGGSSAEPTQRPILPAVFQLGEHEELFENLQNSYSKQLLDAAGDMDEAFELWLGLLQDLESYAKEKNYDINGVKIWLNVFWNEDGTISHMAYYPKPRSRMVDFNALKDFLAGFASQYSIPLSSDSKFTHYGSASFPTTPKRINPPKEKPPKVNEQDDRY